MLGLHLEAVPFALAFGYRISPNDSTGLNSEPWLIAVDSLLQGYDSHPIQSRSLTMLGLHLEAVLFALAFGYRISPNDSTGLNSEPWLIAVDSLLRGYGSHPIQSRSLAMLGLHLEAVPFALAFGYRISPNDLTQFYL